MRIRSALLGGLVGMGVASTAVAAPGDLDLAFGEGGLVTTDFLGRAGLTVTDLVPDPSGGVTLVGSSSAIGDGEIALARVDANGWIDTAFGDEGTVNTYLEGHATARAATRLLDGRVVVVGSLDGDLMLARYLATGELDPSFGEAGVVRTPVTPDGSGWRIHVLPDGKLLVTGSVATSGWANAVRAWFLMARYEAGGALDTSFGSGGIVLSQPLDTVARAQDSAVLPDSSIVLVGHGYDEGRYGGDFLIAKYLPDGSLDASFGVDGWVRTDLGETEYAWGMDVDGAGHIVTVGQSSGTAAAALVVRYLGDGAVDLDFGVDGAVVLDLSTRADRGLDIAALPGGESLVVGQGFVGNQRRGFLAKLTAEGSLDAAFGDGGVRFSPAPETGALTAVEVTDWGEIVAVGEGGLGGVFERYTWDGALDASFGEGGHTEVEFDGSLRDAATDLVTMQADGRIVVVGEARGQVIGTQCAAARYFPDGTLDPSFGDGGRVRLDEYRANMQCNAVAVPDDGGVLVTIDVVTSSYYRPAVLLRLTADGTVDPSFGEDGIAHLERAGNPTMRSIALQPDGKIVIAGTAGLGWGAPRPNFGVARFNPDGTADLTFGEDGYQEVDFAGLEDEGQAVMVLPDGSIVLAGYSGLRYQPSDISVARLTPDGWLDPSFGVAGTVLIETGWSSKGMAVASHLGDRILVGGSAAHQFELVRLLGDGSLDSSFGPLGDGIVTTPWVIEPSNIRGSTATGMTVQADGRIVLGGYVNLPLGGRAQTDFALARYEIDGALDGSFGYGGLVSTDFGNADDEQAAGVVMTPMGKILVAGHVHTWGRTERNFALAQYIGIEDPNVFIEALVGQVQELVGVALSNGQGNSLLKKLEAALGQYDRGNTLAAVNMMEAFINEVEALLAAGTLTLAEAEGLLAAAELALGHLEP